MDIVALAAVWFAFFAAFALGVAFAGAEVLAQKRYERERQLQRNSKRHGEGT